MLCTSVQDLSLPVLSPVINAIQGSDLRYVLGGYNVCVCVWGGGGLITISVYHSTCDAVAVSYQRERLELWIRGGGGAITHSLPPEVKDACLDSRLEPRSGIPVSKKQECFFPAHSKSER